MTVDFKLNHGDRVQHVMDQPPTEGLIVSCQARMSIGGHVHTTYHVQWSSNRDGWYAEPELELAPELRPAVGFAGV
jgi:hypothetical protein